MYVHHHPCLRRGNIETSMKLASVRPALLPTFCRKLLRITGILLARMVKSVQRKFSAIKYYVCVNIYLNAIYILFTMRYLIFIFGKCGRGIVLRKS